MKKQSNGNTFRQVYAIVRRIPAGRVTTYGQIARMLCNPHLSQVVGFALHCNPDPAHIPCHRVVNRFGGLSQAFAFGGREEHRRRLSEEGVPFLEDGRVDLQKAMWYGET